MHSCPGNLTRNAHWQRMHLASLIQVCKLLHVFTA
jgi:hypothetical protein